MNNRIVTAFQNTVDFELIWNQETVENFILQYHIRNSELEGSRPIHSKRDLVIALLYHMKAGDGCECLADSSQITRSFASHFSYNITLGGTGIRASMAIEKIGYPSTAHACSLNRHFRDLIPKKIRWISSVPDEGEDFHPHVIVQYPGNVRIHAGDIDFTTGRPNRVIFAFDPPSENLKISDDFIKEVTDANVFLIASFNIIKDAAILTGRLKTVLRLIQALPPQHVVIMEDGCFENPEMRRIVSQTLAPHIDIFSMNEDELQDRLGRRINILDPVAVADAIKTTYQQIGAPTLICHSSYWALAYGRQSSAIEKALESGICMASTRFRLGNDYSRADFEQTKTLPCNPAGQAFCKALSAQIPRGILTCLPCKDLSFVKHPYTIGLGDSFAGGMLPEFLPEGKVT